MARSKEMASALLGLVISLAVHGQEFVPVTDEMLRNPDPADWLMWRRTLGHWGYSPLDQIDRENVRELRLVWTRPLNPGVQEGTPLVYDGVMYFPHPNDITQALDAATGDFIWEYRRPMPDDVNE
jgi:alcohol dehydrogenase (cytochrome c)